MKKVFISSITARFFSLLLVLSSLNFIFSQNLGLIPFRNSQNKWGYCNKQKQLIVPCEFESAFPIVDGLGKYVKNGKVGYVDVTGKIVSEAIYDEGSFSNNGLALVKKNEKFGYINSRGELIIPLKYDKAESFYKGYAEVKINDSCGIIDPTGKVIVPLKYLGVSSFPPFSEGSILMTQSFHPNFSVVFVNKKGAEMFGQSFNRASNFKNRHAAIKSKENNKFGAINNKGKLVVPYEYDIFYDFEFGLAAVAKNKLFGVIDTLGKVVIPFQYKSLRVIDKNYFLVNENDNCFVINRKMERINSINYEAYRYTVDGITQVKKNGNWGFINQKGEEISSFEFEDASYFVDGYGVLFNVSASGDKNDYKVINKKGELVLSPTNYSYFDTENVHDGIVCYSNYFKSISRQLFGIINLKGKKIEPKYYNIPKSFTVKENQSKYLIGGLIKVETNDKKEIGYIDLEGNEYWELTANDRIYNQKNSEKSDKYYGSQKPTSSTTTTTNSNVNISFNKIYSDFRTIESATDVKNYSEIPGGPINFLVSLKEIDIVGVYSKTRIDSYTIQSSTNTTFEGVPALGYNVVNNKTKNAVQIYFINEQNTCFVIDGGNVFQFKGY